MCFSWVNKKSGDWRRRVFRNKKKWVWSEKFSQFYFSNFNNLYKVQYCFYKLQPFFQNHSVVGSWNSFLNREPNSEHVWPLRIVRNIDGIAPEKGQCPWDSIDPNAFSRTVPILQLSLTHLYHKSNNPLSFTWLISLFYFLKTLLSLHLPNQIDQTAN